MVVLIVFVKFVIMAIGFWLLFLFGNVTVPHVDEYGWESVLYPKAARLTLRRYLLGGITAIALAVFIPY